MPAATASAIAAAAPVGRVRPAPSPSSPANSQSPRCAHSSMPATSAVNSASEYPIDRTIDIGCTQNSAVITSPTRSSYNLVNSAQSTTAAAAPASHDTVMAAVP